MEKLKKNWRKSLAMVLVFIIGTAVTTSITRSYSKLREYRENVTYTAWENRLELSDYLLEYGAAIFPKYTHAGRDMQERDEVMMYYDFYYALNNGASLTFALPLYDEFQPHVDLMESELPGDYGIQFDKLGVQMKDLVPQEDLPQLADEGEYMITVDIRKDYSPDAAGHLNYWEGKGLVRLDAFREDVYYDERAAELACPCDAEDTRYQKPYELGIWYGLGIVNSKEDDLIYGIDENTVGGSVSAEQKAADYFKFFEGKANECRWDTPLMLGTAANEIDSNGGYIQCMLLTGQGAQIKEYLSYIETTEYKATILRVLDSINVQ